MNKILITFSFLIGFFTLLLNFPADVHAYWAHNEVFIYNDANGNCQRDIPGADSGIITTWNVTGLTGPFTTDPNGYTYINRHDGLQTFTVDIPAGYTLASCPGNNNPRPADEWGGCDDHGGDCTQRHFLALKAQCQILVDKVKRPEYQYLAPAIGQTVTVDGTWSSTENPHWFTGISYGYHTVSTSRPAGYGVGYTNCPNNYTCHDDGRNPSAGSSSTFDCPTPVPPDTLGFQYIRWQYYTPPSCVITPPPNFILPSTAVQGNPYTFIADGTDPSNVLDYVRIYKSPAGAVPDWGGGPICSNYVFPFDCTLNNYVFDTPGTYEVVCNAHSTYGGQCSGNPWCFPSNPSDCALWADCGISDHITVNVVTPTPSNTPTPTPYIVANVRSPLNQPLTRNICPVCCYGGGCELEIENSNSCGNSPFSFTEMFTCASGNIGLLGKGAAVNRQGDVLIGVNPNPNTGFQEDAGNNGEYSAHAWPAWNTGGHTIEFVLASPTPTPTPTAAPWTQVQGGNLYAGTVNFETPEGVQIMVTLPAQPQSRGAVWSADGTFNYGPLGSSAYWQVGNQSIPFENNYGYYNTLLSKREIITIQGNQNIGSGTQAGKPIYRYENPADPNFTLSNTLAADPNTEMVFLINGNLTINSDINIGSKAYVFIVNGNVTVAPTVNTIYGLYIVNKNDGTGTFATGTNGRNDGTDLPFTVNGMVYAHSMNLQRVYYSYSTPAHTFVYQPQYLALLMEYLGESKVEWQQK